MIIADRVSEHASTAGSAQPVTLAGAVSNGYRRFSSVFAVGQVGIPHCVLDIVNGDWEVRLGTLSSANTLTQTRLFSSSNSDLAVPFLGNAKRVFVVVPADVLQSLEPASLPDRISVGGRYFGLSYETDGRYRVIAEDDASTIVVQRAGWATENVTGDLA